MDPSSRNEKRRGLSGETCFWIILAIGLPAMIAVWFVANIQPEHPFMIPGQTFGWVTYISALVILLLVAFGLRFAESNHVLSYQLYLVTYVLLIALHLVRNVTTGNADWFGLIGPTLLLAGGALHIHMLRKPPSTLDSVEERISQIR